MGDGESLSKRTQLTVNLRRLKQNVAKFPWYVALYVVVAVTAAAMRFWDLGVRAFHHDESLHALYSWNLYAGEGYIHNPMMHGPFQMEATAGLFFLFGDNDYTARLLYAIAGTALVLLPLLFRSRLGNWGALFTSMLLAFSPAMLYYSRFARNDILMAVWALGIVIAMWRYLDEGVGDAQGKVSLSRPTLGVNCRGCDPTKLDKLPCLALDISRRGCNPIQLEQLPPSTLGISHGSRNPIRLGQERRRVRGRGTRPRTRQR